MSEKFLLTKIFASKNTFNCFFKNNFHFWCKINCSRENGALFFMLWTDTNSWLQVYLIPNLTANLNCNKTAYLGGWWFAFGSQKVNSLRNCTVNVWITMKQIKVIRSISYNFPFSYCLNRPWSRNILRVQWSKIQPGQIKQNKFLENKWLGENRSFSLIYWKWRTLFENGYQM